MVTHIEQEPDGAWRVHYVDVDAGVGRRKRQIVGKIVILAAGIDRIHRDPAALAR